MNETNKNHRPEQGGGGEKMYTSGEVFAMAVETFFKTFVQFPVKREATGNKKKGGRENERKSGADRRICKKVYGGVLQDTGRARKTRSYGTSEKERRTNSRRKDRIKRIGQIKKAYWALGINTDKFLRPREPRLPDSRERERETAKV